MSQPLSVNIMTAAFVPGDAIGNYIRTSAQIWRQWGVRTRIYADHIAPVYGGEASPSSAYLPTRSGILWYHYSIFADNITIAQQSNDFKIMDFHGVTPPHLFEGQGRHLQELCRKGLAMLPETAASFDAFVVHSEYTRQQLLDIGCQPERIFKLPLIVNTSHFPLQQATPLDQLLCDSDYLLFVGRIVPQKDIAAMIQIFAAAHKKRPTLKLILVGGDEITPGYKEEMVRTARSLGVEKELLFTGKIRETAVLATLLRRARFLIITSDWETFCVPLVEAMYFGTPPIIHQVAPLPEVAGSGGLVIDKNDPVAAAQQILTILETTETYQALREAATKRAAAFTEDALAASLLQMMQQLFPNGEAT